MTSRSIDNWDIHKVNNQLTNDNCGKHKKFVSDAQAESLADYLVRKYNNAQFRKWYMKLCYRIPTPRIYQMIDEASKGREPSRLFTYLAKRELASVNQ